MKQLVEWWGGLGLGDRSGCRMRGDKGSEGVGLEDGEEVGLEWEEGEV